MAYVKFKELTKSFEFNKELTIDDLPKYVLDYVSEKEFIYKCYKTARDKSIFTDMRMLLFDVDPISGNKTIHIIPYKSISSGAINFSRSKASIILSFDSGYQIKLDFVELDAKDKSDLRELFVKMMENNM